MDAFAVDRLARAFATAGTRRRLLTLLGALPLLGLLSGSDIVAARPGGKAHRRHAPHRPRHAKAQRHHEQRTKHRHDPRSEACIPTGQRCPSKKPRGKHGKHLSCAHCCQGSSVTDASGKQVCGCLPNGGSCTSDSASACCSGFCDGTSCHAAPCSSALPCPSCQRCGTDGLCAPLPDGTGCDDGNACTQADVCQGGRCVGTNPVVCPAPDQCHAGSCDPATGACSTPSRPDGTACDDGDRCTADDQCQAGVCVGTPVSCTTPPVCYTAPGLCHAGSGQCVYPTEPDGTVCDSGLRCCGGDCVSGTCCSNADCTGTTPICGASHTCVACTSTSECPSNTVCALSGACERCTVSGGAPLCEMPSALRMTAILLRLCRHLHWRLRHRQAHYYLRRRRGRRRHGHPGRFSGRRHRRGDGRAARDAGTGANPGWASGYRNGHGHARADALYSPEQHQRGWWRIRTKLVGRRR